MDVSIDNLKGNHQEHDFFIRSYLTSSNQDIVLNELEEMQEYEEYAARLEELKHDEDTKIHNLAVYILLTQYPNKWWDLMFQAAYNLLVGLLKIIKDSPQHINDPNSEKKLLFNYIYPPNWTQKIFRIEQILSPVDIQGIIFGIDPISKGTPGDFQNYATGHAFTFDMPADQQEKSSSSTKGLQKSYWLTKDINFNSSQTVEDNFICEKKIAFVNYIRTIMRNSKAGDRNAFNDAWDEYNYQWLTAVPNIQDKVLIFQNEDIFGNYAPKTTTILQNPVFCRHPSYNTEEYSFCLKEIGNDKVTFFLKGSVVNFKNFLESLGAGNVLSCRCVNCLPKNILTFQAEDFELLKSLVYCGALDLREYAVYISDLTGNLLCSDRLCDFDSKFDIYNFLVENIVYVVQYLELIQEMDTLEMKIQDLVAKKTQLENLENDIDEKKSKKELRKYIDGLEGEFELTYNPDLNDLELLKKDLENQINVHKETLENKLKDKQNEKKSIEAEMNKIKEQMAKTLDERI